MPANQKGIGARLYYNTATFSTPTWVHVSIVQDWTMNQKPEMAEVRDRSSTVIRKVPTIQDASCGGTFRTVPDSVIYLAFRTADLNKTTIDILCLTGVNTNNGEVGWRYEAAVEDMTMSQAINGILQDTVALCPHGESTNVVQSASVAAGAPVFTTQ